MNCQHCEKGWSAEDMVLSYMKNLHDIHLSHFPETDIQKLKTMILQHQIHGKPGQQNTAIVNAAYNHHMHWKNCFDKEAAKTSINTKFENAVSESSNDSRNLSNSNNACDLTEQKGKSKCGRKRTTKKC